MTAAAASAEPSTLATATAPTQLASGEASASTTKTIPNETSSAGVEKETSAAAASGSADKEQPIDKDSQEKLEIAQKHKELGNKLFGEGKTLEALKEWHHCLLYAAGINSFASQYGNRSSESQNQTAKEMVISVNNNLCAAYIKQEKWDRAIAAATKVINMAGNNDKPNVKALYRRAQAYHKLGDQTRAARDLDAAMDVAPNDAGVRQLAKSVTAASDAELAKATAHWKGFLNSGSSKAASSGTATASEKGKGKAVAA